MTLKYRVDLAPSDQYASRLGADVDVFQVHHGASLWPALLRTLTGTARTVSSSWAIGGGEIVLNVPLHMRPFVSGAASWDRRSESAEVANDRIGGAWTVAETDFHNLARVIADWSTRRNVPITDRSVITQQELYRRHGVSYPTACPGDLQRRKPELLALARKYQAGMPDPAPAPPEEEEDEMKPTVHVRTEGALEYTLAHPQIGADLKPGASRKDGDVTVFRGFMVSGDAAVQRAWARMYAKGSGGETSRTNRAEYIEIQREATRVSVEVAV